MLYETEENKNAEDKLRTALGDAYGYNMVALPIKYSLDCIAYKGKEAKAFFEFKCRTVASTEYDTALVNLHKVIAAANITKATGLKCWLVVQWIDMVGFIDFQADKEIGMSKRRDRNEAADLFAYYPVSGFKSLSLY
jgi:hypothetical protein